MSAPTKGPDIVEAGGPFAGKPTVLRVAPGPGAPPEVTGPPVEYLNLAQLAEQGIPAVEWIVPGWLTVRETCICCGRAGAGKSTTAAQLAIAVADVSGATDWCGLMPARRGDVLVFDEEQDEAECADVYLRLSVPPAALEHLHVAVGAGINLSAALERVRAEVERFKPVLVVVDSMQATFGVPLDGEQQAIVEVFQALKRLRTRYGCAFLLLAHPRKSQAGASGRGNGDSGHRLLTMDDVFGSQAQQAQVNALWLIQSRPQDSGDHVVLEAHKRRRVAKLPALRIEYHSPGDGQPIVLTGRAVAHSSERGERQHAKGEASRERVARVVQDSDGPVSRGEIVAALERTGVNMSEGTVKRHLAGLVESGEIEPEGSNRSTRYRAATGSPAQMDEGAGSNLFDDGT